jgi:hypothetical protein
LGCIVCQEVHAVGTRRVAGSHAQLPKEWMLGTVAGSGDTKHKLQKSLRKKIYEHSASYAHKAAVDIKATSTQEPLLSVVIDSQSAHFQATSNVFRTAYYVAKSDRPYSDHPDLIDLQRLNGAKVGRVLHSRVTCVDIIEHVACEMRKKIVTCLVNAQIPFSVLVDESTSLSQKSCLIVYLRFCVDVQSDPTCVFLDLLELHSLTSESITLCIVDCLVSHGITHEVLSKFWLGFGSDGASVMIGCLSGVYTRLKERYPNLIGWHCFNHRLELSVHDAVKTCTEVNHFKAFMDKLYTLYSASPKNRRALADCAAEVSVQLQKIGRVLDNRWVASSFRAVRAVWSNYLALETHFDRQSKDFNLEGKERAQFSGLSNVLRGEVFVRNLGLMYDALEELANLSESLQKVAISLPRAQRLITRQVEVFTARKVMPGEHYSEACTSVENGSFQGVAVLPQTGRQKEINKDQFYQCLVDSLSRRLLPDSERGLCTTLAEAFPTSWPCDLAPEYGEKALKFLCSRFAVDHSVSLKEAYRDYKEARGAPEATDPALKVLLNAVGTLPVSTAECERGFSKMNIICTALRSALTVQHISCLMLVSLDGPPLMQWDPLPYVKSWLAKGRRDSTSTAGPSRKGYLTYLPTDEKMSLWKIL